MICQPAHQMLQLHCAFIHVQYELSAALRNTDSLLPTSRPYNQILCCPVSLQMFLVSPVQDRTNGSHALSDFLLPLLWQGSSLGASFVPSTMSKDFDSTFSSMQVALQGCNRTAVKLQKQPFSVARSFQSSASVIASITLSLTPGLDVTQHTIRHAITSIASSSNETHSHIYHFSTQEQQYVLHTSREERAAPVAEDDSSSDSIVAKAPSAKRLKTS